MFHVRLVCQPPLSSHILAVWQQILERRIVPKQPQQGFQSQPHSIPVVQPPAVQYPSKLNAPTALQSHFPQTAVAGQQSASRSETVTAAGFTMAVQQATQDRLPRDSSITQEPLQHLRLSQNTSMPKNTSDTAEKLQQAVPVLLASLHSSPLTGAAPPPPSGTVSPPPIGTAPPLPTETAPPLPAETAPPLPTATFQPSPPPCLPLVLPQAGLATELAPSLLPAASILFKTL